MKILRVITIILHFVVGLFGLMGGSVAVLSPDQPFGISPEVLKNGPFTNFLIPGLTLFIVIGLGHILTALTILRKTRYYPYMQGILAALTLGWILIQCWVMEEINGLHITIFALGAVQGINALMVIYRERMFPFTLKILRNVK